MSRIHWVPSRTGTPKDRDEVNRRELWVCDGWLCYVFVYYESITRELNKRCFLFLTLPLPPIHTLCLFATGLKKANHISFFSLFKRDVENLCLGDAASRCAKRRLRGECRRRHASQWTAHCKFALVLGKHCLRHLGEFSFMFCWLLWRGTCRTRPIRCHAPLVPHAVVDSAKKIFMHAIRISVMLLDPFGGGWPWSGIFEACLLGIAGLALDKQAGLLTQGLLNYPILLRQSAAFGRMQLDYA